MKRFWLWLRCLFGLHDWRHFVDCSESVRQCRRCGRTQFWEPDGSWRG